MMETIEIIIAINDNNPWSNYAARAISAQKLTLAEIVKITIVTRNIHDKSVEDFKLGLDPSQLMLVQTIECPLGSQGTEMSMLAKSSIADFVCFTTGYSYWINNQKLEKQITELVAHENTFSWHRALVRSQEVQQIFPMLLSQTGELSISAYDIPWTSLVFPTELLSKFDASHESINLIGLVNHLRSNFKWNYTKEPLSIIQNSAGRGPLALNLVDFANSQFVGGEFFQLNWTKLLENGTLSNSHIEDMVFNYKHKVRMSPQEQIGHLVSKTKQLLIKLLR